MNIVTSLDTKIRNAVHILNTKREWDATWLKRGSSPTPPVPPEPVYNITVIPGTKDRLWSIRKCPETGCEIIFSIGPGGMPPTYTVTLYPDKYDAETNTWYWEGEMIVSDGVDTYKAYSQDGNLVSEMQVFIDGERRKLSHWNHSSIELVS